MMKRDSGNGLCRINASLAVTSDGNEENEMREKEIEIWRGWDDCRGW